MPAAVHMNIPSCGLTGGRRREEGGIRHLVAAMTNKQSVENGKWIIVELQSQAQVLMRREVSNDSNDDNNNRN